MLSMRRVAGCALALGMMAAGCGRQALPQSGRDGEVLATALSLIKRGD